MDYKELDVWKEAKILVCKVYENTRAFPESEIFGLVMQMRRASVSVVSNISEGCGRNSSADIIRFLHMARGSLNELETQLFVSFDLDFIEQEKLDEILDLVVKCKRLVNGFIRYLKNRKSN